jgi:pimeloyl-ACP methyl ester carboxylesterase
MERESRVSRTHATLRLMIGRLGREAIGRTVAPLVDGAFKAALLSRSRASRAKSSAESLGPRERAQALRAIAAFYDRTEHFVRPETFFGVQERIEPTVTNVRGSRVIELAWPSERPPIAEDLRAPYLAPKENRIARARWFRGKGDARPTIVLVHGYMGGAWAFEERAWPIDAFLRRGLDAVLFVLPFHGPRGNGRRPLFPGSDPRFTVEGFRQAIFDLDALVGHLRANGASHVGVMGMSLGGYTTALAATAVDVDFAAPFVPLASLADFARDDDRFVGTDEDRDEQHRLLENAYAVVSPFSRAPRMARERIVVIGGERDRITPIAHAEKLAAHFGAPLVRLPGGHLIQVGRGEGFRALLAMLRRTGVLAARR